MKKTTVLVAACCLLLWAVSEAVSTPKVNNIPDNAAASQQAKPQGPADSTVMQLSRQRNSGESAPALLSDIPRPEKKEFSGTPNVPDPNVILQGGDTFESARLIRSLPYIDSGSTEGYYNDYDGNCGGSGAPDVVYLYQPLVDDAVTFSLCYGTYYDSKLYICANGDPNNILACNDDGCNGLQSVITYPVETGTNYYIVVDGFANSYGNYTLQVTGTGPVPGACGDDNVGFFNGFPDRVNGVTSLRTFDGGYDRWVVDDLELTEETFITDCHWYSTSSAGFDWNGLGDFIILSDSNGTPGHVLFLGTDRYATREATGEMFMYMPEYIYTIEDVFVQLPAGRYWLGLRPVSTSAPGNYWLTAQPGLANTIYVSYPDLGRPLWTPGRDVFGADYNVSFCVGGVAVHPNACGTSLYSNGPDGGYTWASQCDLSTPFAAGTADDFSLPGSGDYEIDSVAAYIGMFYGGDPGPNFTGIVVTIYANNTDSVPNEPGGHPIDGDPNCAHIETMQGGIISSHILTPNQYTYSQLSPHGNYQFILPITPPARIHGSTTYWLEVEPIMDYAPHGQCGLVPSTRVTGNFAKVYMPISGNSEWSDVTSTDMAFCLFGDPVAPNCDYIVGDANGNGIFNGLDIVYSVNYFKYGQPAPPYTCDCPRGSGDNWFVAGDVNGSCGFNGLDVVYSVAYLKGGPAPMPCPNCPPIGR